MAISIIGGSQVQRGTGYRVKETLSQSTATTFQDINLTTPITHLGMGTESAATTNLYTLATGGVEGLEKSLLATATGFASVLTTAGTATGMWVFTEADDYLRAIYEDGKWRVIQSTATLSTGT